MELAYTEVLGCPVYSREVEKNIAKLKDIILDTETGKIIGIVCQKNLVIAAIDILQWGDRIEVNDHMALHHPSETVFINEVLQKKNSIMNKKVKTTKKAYLGVVKDYFFNPDFLLLEKIYVKKTLFSVLTIDKRLIPRSEIIKITKKRIIVNDTSTLAKYKLKSLLVPRKSLSTEGMGAR